MDLLTLEEVLARCEQQGLEVSERTFRYYAVLGLLPRPVKRPDGDARVHYYEPHVLERLAEIRKLQADGHSLKQVKKLLESSGERPPLLRALADGRWQEACRRYLSGPGTRQAALELTQEWLALAGLSPQSMTDRELENCLRHLGQMYGGGGTARSLYGVAGHAALPGLMQKVEAVDTEGFPLARKAQSRLLNALEQLAQGRQLESCARSLDELDRWLAGLLTEAGTPGKTRDS